jgi:hypothetical protein
MRFIRKHLPSLSDSEFAALTCLDQLVKDFEKDPRFKKEFAEALQHRGSIKVRITFRHEVIERGFKRMESGAPICNASACRAVQNIMVHLGNAAVEQANGEK